MSLSSELFRDKMKSVFKTKIFPLKFALIILTISTTIFKSSAQTPPLNYDQIANHISNCLGDNYHPDSVAVSKLCRRACIFIKFKVDPKGQIINLSFSKDSIFFIKEALTKAVSALQKDTKLMSTLKKMDKTIIQPFIYYYQAGCAFPKTAQLSEILKETRNDKPKKSYFEIRDDMEFFGANLLNMLNFSDGNLHAIDCILLSPIEVAAGSIE